MGELGYPTEILNAGQSDTTAGGLRRVDWLLKQNPDLLIVELGANDGMRGNPLAEIEKNLNGIIDKAQDKDIDVFLMDMYIPSNSGQEYTDGFHAIFAKTSLRNKILHSFLFYCKRWLENPNSIKPTGFIRLQKGMN